MSRVRLGATLLVAGIALAALAVLADQLGFGASAALGWKQVAGLLIGFGLALAGAIALGSAEVGRPKPSPGLGVAGLQLAALCALAVAQPLFGVLSKNPEFFVVRGSTGADVLILTGAVILLPPVALLAAEVLAGLVRAGLRRYLHTAFVGTLTAILAVQAMNEWESLFHEVTLMAAVVSGALAALAYEAWGAARSFVTALAPAPVLVALLFLFSAQVSKLLFEDEAEARATNVMSDTPVVIAIFDELPVTSLLRRNGEIDAERYPSFARLARSSTWFRNATTISDNTTRAVPAILTGSYPPDGTLPRASDHPNNVFTLLGGSHRLHVSEEVTRLCPQRLCRGVPLEPFARRMRSLASDLGAVYRHLAFPPDLRGGLPDVTTTWGDFQREDAKDPLVRYERFTNAIRPSPRPSLEYVHTLLPHIPWLLLPSGKWYEGELFGISLAGPRFQLGGRWGGDEFLVAQGYQRHLLQLAYTDRLLGKLLRRLRDTGLYDRAAIVVVSDHGVSFRRRDVRRGFTGTNLADMAPVPLFVKAPGQSRGRVVDKRVQTVDIVPTLADLLRARIPWRTDGRSMLDPGYPDRSKVRLVRNVDGKRLSIDAAVLEREKRAALARKDALFGSGASFPAMFGFGPNRDLLGRRLSALPLVAGARVRARVDDREKLRNVDPDGPFLPAFLTGRLDGAAPGAQLELALAVNGRVAAVARSFPWRRQEVFAALVPESALRAGANQVRVLLVTRSRGRTRVHPIG